MAAELIQKNATPFERLELDTITLDIIENAMKNLRYEMDAVLFRSAMSPVIRMGFDVWSHDRYRWKGTG